jgi:hypothetical protein
MSSNKKIVFHRYRVNLIARLFGQWLKDAVQELFKIDDFCYDFGGFELPKIRSY